MFFNFYEKKFWQVIFLDWAKLTCSFYKVLKLHAEPQHSRTSWNKFFHFSNYKPALGQRYICPAVCKRMPPTLPPWPLGKAFAMCKGERQSYVTEGETTVSLALLSQGTAMRYWLQRARAQIRAR